MPLATRLCCCAVALAGAFASPAAAQQRTELALPTVVTHDNVKPAGRLVNGELRLSLWAGLGKWAPAGKHSPELSIAAFGEEGGPLSAPSPLVRVPEGTTVHASIRNTLSQPMRVRGLCDRPSPCEPLVVPAGGTSDVRFVLRTSGTFHYWASTMGAAALEARFKDDAQLGGAIVVDRAGAPTSDRIFVMGLWRETPIPGDDLTVVNGRSWPLTERLAYSTGDSVRWRIVNLTTEAHAMHLHGFYFRVDSAGDGTTDAIYADNDRRMAVTEQMPPGRTITLTWVPERAGNWLFHCHMLVHMMPHGSGTHEPESTSAGMGGLVLGVRVTGSDRAPAKPAAPVRKFALTIDHDTRNGEIPSYRVGLTPGQAINDRSVPGPVMVLTRGEPIAVELINRLREPTAIHWHGIELESYDDGVPGFGGVAGSVTPPVAPGGTFTARFTPSRAGTFIYHTHWHNPAQLAGGIYGPIVVLEPGEQFDPARDHIFVIGYDGEYESSPEPMTINGEATPQALELRAGVGHRLRFINITPNNVALTVQLVSRFDPVQWTTVAKDGAATPEAQRKPVPARQLVSVGETYDFELPPMPPRPVGLWLELRRGNGEMLIQWPVRVVR